MLLPISLFAIEIDVYLGGRFGHGRHRVVTTYYEECYRSELKYPLAGMGFGGRIDLEYRRFVLINSLTIDGFQGKSWDTDFVLNRTSDRGSFQNKSNLYFYEGKLGYRLEQGKVNFDLFGAFMYSQAKHDLTKLHTRLAYFAFVDTPLVGLDSWYKSRTYGFGFGGRVSTGKFSAEATYYYRAKNRGQGYWNMRVLDFRDYCIVNVLHGKLMYFKGIAKDMDIFVGYDLYLEQWQGEWKDTKRWRNGEAHYFPSRVVNEFKFIHSIEIGWRVRL